MGEIIRLTPPNGDRARGARARLYIRWMPHLGAEAVALYELLRVLPDVGHDAVETEELAELLRATPEKVEEAVGVLLENGFLREREGWFEAAEHPPVAKAAGAAGEDGSVEADKPGRRSRHDDGAEDPGSLARGEGSSGGEAEKVPGREIEVIRAEPEGVTPDDYFRYMGSLPAPHILEFLNGYCGRDGLSPDAVREALRIASERDARRVGYVRSILERWVERGVKTVSDVERFEKDRKLRLVEESGAVRGGALKLREGVSDGPDRQSAARRREGYEWLFGE